MSATTAAKPPAESFFATLDTGRAFGINDRTRAQAETNIFYIETLYNRRCRRPAGGSLRPITGKAHSAAAINKQTDYATCLLN